MNPRRGSGPGRLLLALVTTVSIAGGCAVLTIDVDVYKGPLANHEDVQLQQLVAMAIGARPILLELMNELERKDGDDADELLTDYVPPHADGTPALKKSGAQRVNAILGLYRDRSVLVAQGETVVDESLRKLIEAAQAQVTAYQRAFEVLNGDLGETWETDIAPGLKKQVVLDKVFKKITDPFDRLTRLAYDFFHPLGGYRYDGEDWTETHDKLRDAKLHAALDLKDPEISKLDPKKVFGEVDGEADKSANAGFLALSRAADDTRYEREERGALEAYAELLFRSDAKAAKETFITKVRSVANAFLESRDARSRLLAILLDGLSRADPESTDPTPDPDAKPDETDAESRDSRRTTVRERARREAADVAVELLHPKYTLAVLSLAKHKSVPIPREKEPEEVIVPDAIRNLRMALLEKTAASKTVYDPPREIWHWTDVNAAWAVVSKRLNEALIERPRETAAALAIADVFFKSKAFRYRKIWEEAGLESKHASRTKRAYGLSSGPLDGLSRAGDTASQLEIEQKRQERARGLLAFQAVSVGLGEGRLEKGLETLMEEYLDAREDCLTSSADGISEECRNDPKVRGARELLLEALVRFAEKVLVIANNDVLLREIQDKRAAIIPRLLWGTVTNVLGFRSIEAQDPYPLVLQAVGNSILVQADELRHRRSHEAKLRDRVDNEVRALNSTLPRDATAALAGIVGQLHDEYLAKKRTVDEKTKEVGKLQQRIDAAEPGEDLGRLQREKEAVESEIRATQSEMERLAKAIRIVEERRGDWAKKHASTFPRPAAFLSAVIADLSVDDGGNPATGDQATAADVLRARRTALVWMSPLTADPEGDARKVLDALISTLEYQRLEAIKAGGERSPRALQLTSTLAAAYEYRSGMVYIRPPSAYLRTSYPSTSLQSDPDLRRRNMLGENAGRGLPFSEQVRDFFHPEGVLNARTVADIDKQFWQSINRVRVNGVGNTNYAIAKDDIGNWYLKTYSTDPKDIINSARNLAMFGAGAAAGASALQTLPRQETVEGILSEKTVTKPSVTEATFRRFQSDYDAKSEQDLKDLGGDLSQLPSRVRSAWTAAGLNAGPSDSLGRILDQAKEQLEGDTPEGKNVEHGVEVLKLLRRVRRFRSMVIAGITDTANGQLSPEKKRGARTIADRETRMLVERYLDRRRRSVEQYHAAIVNFGGGLTDPDASAQNGS